VVKKNNATHVIEKGIDKIVALINRQSYASLMNPKFIDIVRSLRQIASMEQLFQKGATFI
jgi:hypothetical protein